MEFSLFLYHSIYCIMDTLKEYLVLRHVIGFQTKRKPVLLFPALAVIPVGILGLERFVPDEYISIFYLPLILVVMLSVIGIWNVKSFLLSIITFVCICELDFFVAAFMKLIPEGVSHISRDNLLAGFISLVLIAIVAAICKGYDISFYKKNLRHRKEFIAIEIIVLFINLGIIGTFFGVLNENSAGSYGNVLLIMVMILSMLFSVITLIFFMAIANVREYRMIHEVNQRQLERQKRHYEQLRELDRETRKFRHDLKNHFFVLAGFLREGKQEQAREYLQEMTGQFSEVQKVISTGNDIVDAILNDKFRECEEKRITMEVKGILYAPLQISDYDICTILVNAMDNAVEACEHIKNERKWIQVSIGMYQEYLHLLISNSYEGEFRLKTGKRDRHNHGFGLENLQESVNKNCGKVKMSAENGRFNLDILVRALECEE